MKQAVKMLVRWLGGLVKIIKTPRMKNYTSRVTAAARWPTRTVTSTSSSATSVAGLGVPGWVAAGPQVCQWWDDEGVYLQPGEYGFYCRISAVRAWIDSTLSGATFCPTAGAGSGGQCPYRWGVTRAARVSCDTCPQPGQRVLGRVPGHHPRDRLHRAHRRGSHLRRGHHHRETQRWMIISARMIEL